MPVSALSDRVLDFANDIDKSNERCVGLEISLEPLPTTDRAVSGRKKAMRRRRVPERILRSQKIQRHPGDSAKAPPKIGPTAVAMFGLGEGVSLMTTCISSCRATT